MTKDPIKGRRVTGFTNEGEVAVGLTEVVPFLLEDLLKARGGVYGKGADWAPYVQVDGRFVTGRTRCPRERQRQSY